MARVDFTGAKLYVNPLATGNNRAGYANRFGTGGSNNISVYFKSDNSYATPTSPIGSSSDDVNSVRIACSGIVPHNIVDSHRIYLGQSASSQYFGYYIYVPNGFATGDTFAFEMILTAPMEPEQSGTT